MFLFRNQINCRAAIQGDTIGLQPMDLEEGEGIESELFDADTVEHVEAMADDGSPT